MKLKMIGLPTRASTRTSARLSVVASVAFAAIKGVLAQDPTTLYSMQQLEQLDSLGLLNHVEAQQYLQLESFRKVSGLASSNDPLPQFGILREIMDKSSTVDRSAQHAPQLARLQELSQVHNNSLPSPESLEPQFLSYRSLVRKFFRKPIVKRV